MKNRGTTTALLTTLFFGGLAALWWVDRADRPSAIERERRNARILPGLVDARPDDVRKVEIVDARKGSIVFERTRGRGWQMTRPSNVAANPSMVEDLAFKLKELSRRPEAATLDADPAEYGLSGDSTVIRVWGASTDAPIAGLELGRVSLDRRFVRVEGASGIEVVPARSLEMAELPPLRWRDREVFRIPSFEVDRLTIRDEAGHRLGLDRGRDAWRIVEPVRALADPNKVEGLVANLASLRVLGDDRFVLDDVPDADLARYGLDSPRLVVEAATTRNVDRPAQAVAIGKAVEGNDALVYARRLDQNDVVALEARVVRNLTTSPEPYRSERVADVDPNRATRFRIEAKSAERAFDVARSGNRWFFRDPEVAPADTKAVVEFFSALESLRAMAHIAPTPQALADAGIGEGPTYQVWQADLPPPARPGAAKGEPKPLDEKLALTLRLGRRDAGKKIFYARADGDEAILAIPESIADRLPRSSLSMRDRLVLTIPADRIDRLTVDAFGRKLALVPPILRDASNNPRPRGKAAPRADGWWMVEPVAGPADAESMGRLLLMLAALRVDGYASDSGTDLGRFGLDAPAFRLTWSARRQGTDPRAPKPPSFDRSSRKVVLDDQTLIVGGVVDERPKSRYAMVVGHPVVFILGPDALETLDAEFRDRDVLRFDAAEVSNIRATWPDPPRSLDLVPRPVPGPNGERSWRLPAPGQAIGFDYRAAVPILDAMASLKIDRYLQYEGSVDPRLGLTPARLVVELTRTEDRPPIRLEVGNPDGKAHRFARLAGGPPGAVFLVDENPFAAWADHPPRDRPETPGPDPNRELPENVFKVD